MARIAVTRKGEDLEALTERLFKFDDPKSDHKAAAASLAAANRHLPLKKGGSRGKALEEGTFVVVPEVEGATHKESSIPLHHAAAGVLLEGAKQGIERLQVRLDEDRRQSERELGRTLELADSERLQRAAAADKAVAARLDMIRERAKARLESLAETDQTRRTVLDRASGTLTDFLDRYGRID